MVCHNAGMVKKGNRITKPLSDHEQGAAFIAWYKDTMALDGFSGGMITRAQAARILGVSQMAVNRLVGRGFLRARHFPKDPDIESIPVGIDDPFYHRLIATVSDLVGEGHDIDWYEACYVSLDDVVVLWERNEQREKSRLNWKRLKGNVDEPLVTGPHYVPPKGKVEP